MWQAAIKHAVLYLLILQVFCCVGQGSPYQSIPHGCCFQVCTCKNQHAHLRGHNQDQYRTSAAWMMRRSYELTTALLA